MLMHRNMNPMEGWDDGCTRPNSLKVEVFTPLSQRIAQSQYELVAGIEKLRQMMDVADFDRYIESLVALRQKEDSVWLITDREMHRSLLERDFVPHIKRAFSVSHVRVISQA